MALLISAILTGLRFLLLKIRAVLRIVYIDQRAKSLDGTIDVNKDEINKGLFYIGYNRNINEVLVTGGDALMISKTRLQYVLEELRQNTSCAYYTNCDTGTCCIANGNNG